MSNNVFVGIDTSNYTTSFAVADEKGDILLNVKKLLPVKNGECGLRQSDAVFAHVKNLPLVMREASAVLDGKNILAVGVSTRPRSIENSYMPCFLTGIATADTVSAATGAPVYGFSHQCGHIMAAVYSSKNENLLKDGFGAFHLSGGTTELLLSSFNGRDFDTEIAGATKDISAGQLVDRVGVMLGLGFPAGKELEKLALSAKEAPKVPKIKLDGCYVNMSGAENLAKKLYEDTKDASLVASFVFEYLSEVILQMSKAFLEKYGSMPILYVGGVMSNSIIKNKLKKEIDAYFAEPEFSSDNASGVALLARNAYLYK